MGTAVCCMALYGVRLMGSNVLMHARDTFLWPAEYSWPWHSQLQRVQLIKCGVHAYHTRALPSIKITDHIKFFNWIQIVGNRS